jgi:argininosuccinate lyase
LFGEDVSQVLTVNFALAQRDISGGTSPAALQEQLAAARKQLLTGF